MKLLAILMLFSVALFSCNDDDNNTTTNNAPYTISGDATGAQMVPSVTGTGTGTISGTYNPQTRVLTYSSGWTGLSGAPSGGGFYSGNTGVAGVAIGTPWTIQSDATGTGTTSGTMTLTDEQAKQFLGGGWYYSYGTAANPTGEVRGQITANR